MKDISEEGRNILFLQGNASPFFGRVGMALQARGHTVHRINFTGGDVAFWPLSGAVNYRGAIDGWLEFLAQHLSKWAITDIILMADCRPLHSQAIGLAHNLQLPVYVFEEGYLRPHWITLERGGVNAFSSLGRDPDWFVQAANDLAPWTEPQPAVNSMARRAIEDIVYVLATLIGSRYFSGYCGHRPWSSWVEYTSGGRRFLKRPAAKRNLAKALDQLEGADRPYYLFPLQIEADSQIQYHSPFNGLRPAIELVIRSFSCYAPAESTLIITEHPLDTCPFDWRTICARFAAAYGVEDRVLFFEGGSPERSIQGCRGVVTINSTLGYLALAMAKPLVALGSAIYDIAELTFQHGLDRFWCEGAVPDPRVFDAFRRVVAARTQVNGSFYSAAGVKLAVAGSVARIEAELRKTVAVGHTGSHKDALASCHNGVTAA